MSRSHRYHPVIWGSGHRGQHWWKKMAAQATRRRNKVRVEQGLDPLNPRQIVCSWTKPHDYKISWWPSETNRWNIYQSPYANDWAWTPEKIARWWRK